MVDGAVSIAVRSAYPGKQTGLQLLSDVLQEAKNIAAKSCVGNNVPSATSSNGIIDNKANDVTPSACQWRCHHVQIRELHDRAAV